MAVDPFERCFVSDTDLPADGVPLTLDELWIYPVKSCAGLRVRSATLLDTGLEWDRTWMVVGPDGVFVTQREHPRMALVQPRLHMGRLELRAPGMLPLLLALDAAEGPCQVRVWDDTVAAYDMGDTAAQWFTDFLVPDGLTNGERLRLARFDPEVRRLSSFKWTGGLEAPNQFGDGFPLLVVSQASLADLNQRLAARGLAPVDVRRFRPNLVLGGVEAHDEDRFTSLHLEGAGAAGEAGAVLLQPVKPCPRCPIPDIDPDTGAPGQGVGATLQTYRADVRVGGALTFGMNVIVRKGAETLLAEGQPGVGVWGSWT